MTSSSSLIDLNDFPTITESLSTTKNPNSKAMIIKNVDSLNKTVKKLHVVQQGNSENVSNLSFELKKVQSQNNMAYNSLKDQHQELFDQNKNLVGEQIASRKKIMELEAESRKDKNEIAILNQRLYVLNERVSQIENTMSAVAQNKIQLRSQQNQSILAKQSSQVLPNTSAQHQLSVAGGMQISEQQAARMASQINQMSFATDNHLGASQATIGQYRPTQSLQQAMRSKQMNQDGISSLSSATQIGQYQPNESMQAMRAQKHLSHHEPWTLEEQNRQRGFPGGVPDHIKQLWYGSNYN